MSALDEAPAQTRHARAPDWDELVDELEFLLDSDVPACARRAVEAVELARRLGAEDAEMRLGYYAASAHHLQGADSEALAAAARTEQLARDRGELVWHSRALACRGLVHHDVGDVEDAVDLLTRAVDLRREANDAVGAAEVLNSLGTVYTGIAHFAPQAAEVLSEARRLWLAADDPDRASIALTNLARAYVATSARLARSNPRGASAATRHALEIARQAVDEADAAGLSRTAVDARLAVVGAYLVADDVEGAGAVLETTATMLTRFPSAHQQLALHRLTARWWLLRGEPDEALVEATAGLDLCAQLDRPGERLELLILLAQTQERRGDLGAALAHMHEAHDLTTRRHEAVAERRAVLLSSRLEVERAEKIAEAERRRSRALEERNARLAHEATHDGLTGLANRRALDTALAHWLTVQGRPFALALIDIDHFKRVNDRWSHQVGDQVLVRLGAELRATLRAGDLAARYGGEEFALLLEVADAEAAREACERVRAAIAGLSWDTLMPDEQITVSIGVVTGTPGRSAGALLSAADAALYEAKASGRNRVQPAR